MIHLRISEDALQDLADGFLFYEAQQAGLGDYFVSCLRADIESLRVHAGIHRIVYLDYRRILSVDSTATGIVTADQFARPSPHPPAGPSHAGMTDHR